MIYADMHCDTLTVCLDKGLNLSDCNLQTSFEKLSESRCGAQCFAVFTDGEPAAARDRVFKSLALFKKSLQGGSVVPVLCAADLKRAEALNKTGAILTIENLGFIESDLTYLDRLHKEGVRMASLVWNYENQLARPNLVFKDGIPEFEKRDMRGLTKLGAEVVERLDELKIIVDISHLSDGGALQILDGRKTPIVASHSNAAKVCNVSRNLTDELIKKIADCGGVIGVNFCFDFLGGSPKESVLAHIKHLIKVGGEDVAAFGSDFDGIPPYPEIPDCTAMPALLSFLEASGIPHRILQKIAYQNFTRVFSAVCG